MTSRRGAGMNSAGTGTSTAGTYRLHPNIYGDWRQRSGVGDGGGADCGAIIDGNERRMTVRARSVMRSAFRNGAFQRGLQVILVAFFAVTASATAQAQATKLDDLVSAVVRVKTFINPDGTSV